MQLIPTNLASVPINLGQCNIPFHCNFTSLLWNYRHIFGKAIIDINFRDKCVALFGGDFAQVSNILIILV